MSRRPWLAPALAAVLIAVSAFIPVSWQRTVGHDVHLTLSGVNDPARAGDIAREMKSVLGGAPVSVREAGDNGATTLDFSAFVPAGGVDAVARSQALANALRAHGYAATANATPRREQIMGPVYAFARDLVIRVETDGKTAAQIEAEIRKRLTDEGLANTQVSVKDVDGKREVKVTAQNDKAGSEPRQVQLQLTKNGAPIAPSDGISVEMKRLRTPQGETLKMDVTDHGRKASIEVAHADGMTDAALQSAIDQKLRAAGVNVNIQVHGGQVTVSERK